MKKIVFFLGMLTILISCATDSNRIITVDKLQEISKTTLQEFDLDTLAVKEITGTLGTKIIFKREDFNIKDGQPIQLKLKELYTLEELILNNIQTLTDNGELLESSGVLYISFESEGKEVILKEGRALEVVIPDSKLKDNQLFAARVDSLGQFKWNTLEEAKPVLGERTEIWVENRGTTLNPIFVESERKIVDTVGFSNGDYSRIIRKKRVYALGRSPIFLKKLKWINIDRFVRTTEKRSYTLVIMQNSFEQLNSYVIYENLNSFVSSYHLNNQVTFKNIPVIKGETYVIIAACKNEQLYATKVRLEEKEKLKVVLEKIELSELKELLNLK
ncbi:hypothetical protein [Wenyingzhuangia sp. IMCC45574]